MLATCPYGGVSADFDELGNGVLRMGSGGKNNVYLENTWQFCYYYLDRVDFLFHKYSGKFCLFNIFYLFFSRVSSLTLS